MFLVEALRWKLGDIEKRLGSTSIRGSERATQSPDCVHKGPPLREPRAGDHKGHPRHSPPPSLLREWGDEREANFPWSSLQVTLRLLAVFAKAGRAYMDTDFRARRYV